MNARKNGQRPGRFALEKGGWGALAALAAVGAAWLYFGPGLALEPRMDIRQATGLGLGLLAVLAVALYFLGRLSTERAAWLLLAASFLVHVCYALYTGIDARQHDVWQWNENGHLGYIATLFDSKSLPPHYDGQLYHPPLHHAIAALFVRLCEKMGFEFWAGVQSLRFLPLLYISVATVAAYQILAQLGLYGKSRLLAFALAAGHPTFTILSSSINNDALAYLLSLVCFYWAVRWYKKPGWGSLLPAALALGLAGTAKLSALLLAVPLGFLLIVRLAYPLHSGDGKPAGLRARLPLVWQLLAFGGISLPLGLWHSVYNYARLGQPLGYVPNLAGDFQYVGGYSAAERFVLPFSNRLFSGVFCSVADDYNIHDYLLRCALFGEYTFEGMESEARILTVLNALLGLLVLTSLVWLAAAWLAGWGGKNLLGGTNAVPMGAWLLFCWAVYLSYILFNRKFPFACTMDFRYLLPLVLGGALALGRWHRRLAHTCKTAGRALRGVCWGLVGLFSLASALFYLLNPQ